MKRILCVVTRGGGGLDELRARRLMEGLKADVTFHIVDRKQQSYATASRHLWKEVTASPWDLVYVEGTGIIGGLPLIWASMTRKQRFVLCGGDPIGGFFSVTKGPIIGACFGLYERVLYRACSGFVGWTPYLTGLALSLGARRGVTVEGSVAMDLFKPYTDAERKKVKTDFGLDPTHLVCGVAGSLHWTPRQQYCYGLELVETLKRVRRSDVSMLIVGDGDGKVELEKRVPEPLKNRVVFTGRIPEARVVDALNAMDIGFITQTLDELGSFRLTTKLPEYLAAGLPVAMSPIPGFYDYVGEAGWSLPARHPASPEFHEECAQWLDSLTWDEVHDCASKTRGVAAARFDYPANRRKLHTFVESLWPRGDA